MTNKTLIGIVLSLLILCYPYSTGSFYMSTLEIETDNNEIKSSNLNINAIISTSFVSTWNTSLISTGSSASNQIKLPLHLGGSYNFQVDWGDGVVDTITSYNQAEVTHTYSVEGVYTIIIDGTLQGWKFANLGDRLKISKISQWGNLNFGNLGNYFHGCANLEVNATDTPDLTGTTNMYYAFAGNEKLNANFNNWDVSSVTNMYSMFQYASSFNQPLDTWDVSKVTTMNYMFQYASSFNQPLNTWNVSSVTGMYAMFEAAVRFNQSLSNWDMSRVTTTGEMFRYAIDFNQDIGAWNVSSVTDMREMFSNAILFNHSIENWDVSKVTNMRYLFSDAIAFNQPLNSWNMSSVEIMYYMFEGASSFNQPLDTWDVSKCTNMRNMFAGASSFNQSIQSWDVSNVKSMQEMFDGAQAFNHPLDSWNVSQVTTMADMFYYAKSFNQPLNSWDVSSVTTMRYMFAFAERFNQPLDTWDVSKVTTMRAMYSYAYTFNQNIDSWNVSSVIDMNSLFYKAYNYNQPLNSWDVSEVYQMDLMFGYNYYFNQSLNSWDVSKATSMQAMFFNARDFNQPLDMWNVSSVTDMAEMFYNAYDFNQPINTWLVSNVESMQLMFYNAYDFDQPIGEWDVSGVMDMTGMFSGTELSTANYDDLLVNWANQPLQNDVVFSAGNSKYSFEVQDARQSIIDTYGWMISDGGVVTESTIPEISSPDDQTVLFGDVVNITWTIADEYPNYVNITLDGEILFSNLDWIQNGTVPLEIFNLELGYHTVVLYAVDEFDNVASDTVIVRIIELNTPEVDSPPDLSYDEGTTGNTITWFAYDVQPDICNITIDGEIYLDDIGWANGSIMIDVDGLSAGTYSFTINLFDESGNKASDTVIVTVIDIIPPEFTVLGIETLKTYSGSVTVTVTAVDKYGIKSVSFIFNDAEVLKLTGSPYTWIWDTTEIPDGNYNIKIQVTDVNDNIAEKSFSIFVDNSSPLTSESTSDPMTSDTSESSSANTQTTSSSDNDDLSYNFMILPFVLIIAIRVVKRKYWDK